MQVEVDNFGRLVIPKSVRNHLGIKPGTVLELLEQDQEILLRLFEKTPPLKRDGGILVYTAEASGNLADSMRKEREQRFKDLFQ